MRFAELSVRSLLVLNGGAALALIAFAANAATRADDATGFLAAYVDAIWAFGLGACLAVLVAGLAYLSQTLMVEAEHGKIWNKIGHGLRIVAVVIWLASLTLFVVGIRNAVTSLSSPRTPIDATEVGALPYAKVEAIWRPTSLYDSPTDLSRASGSVALAESTSVLIRLGGQSDKASATP